MDQSKIRELRLMAQDLRITGLKMVEHVRSGHIGGAFSLSEILSVLYFEKMNVKIDNPEWEDRDRLVMSKGHATVALYAALANRGFFPMERLKEFRKIDGHLSGHVEMSVPGVDMSTGSLGQGLSAALGMAVGGKILSKSFFVYGIVGDGEIQEGQIWEALMFAGSHNINNLIPIVDFNKVQLEMYVDRFIGDGKNLADRLTSFGFKVIMADGHDVEKFAAAVDEAKASKNRPAAIIASTVKGRGVSFMENNLNWHGKTPNDEEFAKAFDELNKTRKEWEAVQ
jgi:transketolase